MPLGRGIFSYAPNLRNKDLKDIYQKKDKKVFSQYRYQMIPILKTGKYEPLAPNDAKGDKGKTAKKVAKTNF